MEGREAAGRGGSDGRGRGGGEKAGAQRLLGLQGTKGRRRTRRAPCSSIRAAGRLARRRGRRSSARLPGPPGTQGLPRARPLPLLSRRAGGSLPGPASGSGTPALLLLLLLPPLLLLLPSLLPGVCQASPLLPLLTLLALLLLLPPHRLPTRPPEDGRTSGASSRQEAGIWGWGPIDSRSRHPFHPSTAPSHPMPLCPPQLALKISSPCSQRIHGRTLIT